MGLRSKDAFGSQHCVMEVRGDDWEVAESGTAGPLPFALAKVGRDREQCSVAGVTMYRK
tara:strand:+ start:854 stop:1030 length:177 start_codon:yes stop_codon:yes gene_type:complete